MKLNVEPHKDGYLQGTDGSYELYEELAKEPNIRLEVERAWIKSRAYFLFAENSETLVGTDIWNYRIYPNPLKELEVGQKVLILDTGEEGYCGYKNDRGMTKVYNTGWEYYESRENLIPLND